MPLITLEQVNKYYLTLKEATLAVKDLNFAVEEGEFISLVGPSGCGKSTILSMIAGLIPPSSGKILLEEEEIKHPSQKIGYMLQQDYLLNWRTIKENILFGLEIQKRLNKETISYALQLLEEIGLTNTLNLHPTQLSGGMKQRIALIRTLATNPKVLLLDEPFSALDYQTKLQLEDLIFLMIKKHKKTAILVTHDISEAIAMSDRIIILGKNPGYIKKILTVDEEIRRVMPLQAREIPIFQKLFRTIWKELEE